MATGSHGRRHDPGRTRRAPGHNPYPEDMPSMNTGSSGSGNAGASGALPTPVSPTHGPPDLGSALGPGDWVWMSSLGYWVFVPHEVPHQKGRHQSPGWESEKGRHKGKRPESPKGSPKGPPKGPPKGKGKNPQRKRIQREGEEGQRQGSQEAQKPAWPTPKTKAS